jgi:hypothetical protein
VKWLRLLSARQLKYRVVDNRSLAIKFFRIEHLGDERYHPSASPDKVHKGVRMPNVLRRLCKLLRVAREQTRSFGFEVGKQNLIGQFRCLMVFQ